MLILIDLDASKSLWLRLVGLVVKRNGRGGRKKKVPEGSYNDLIRSLARKLVRNEAIVDDCSHIRINDSASDCLLCRKSVFHPLEQRCGGTNCTK